VRTVWIRRVLVIPSVIMLLVGVQCSLLLHLMANDLQAPEFYTEILSEDSVYSFISAELPRTLYEDFREFQQKEHFSNPVYELGLSDEEVIESMVKIVDQAWIQETIEENGALVLGYLNGTSDEFAIQIDLRPVASNAVKEVNELLEASDFYQFTIDSLVSKTFEGGLILPLGVYLSESEIKELIVKTVSRKWALEQINNSSDLFLEYLLGPEDQFEIVIPVHELKGSFKSNLKRTLRDENIEEYIQGEILFYLTDSSVIGITNLNLQVHLSDEEIKKIIEDIFSKKLVQDILDELIDMSVDYWLGDIELSAMELDVSEIKKLSEIEMEKIVLSKLDEKLQSLRQCTEKEMEQFSSLSAQGLPICFPGDYYNHQAINTRAVYRSQLILSLRDEVLDNLPGVVRLTDTDIDEFIERTFDDDLGVIEATRDMLRDGLMIDSQYLNRITAEDDMANGLWVNIQKGRAHMKDGLRYDNHDLSKDMSDFYSLDRIRQFLFMSRVSEYLSLIFVAIMALLVGVLAQNNWNKRIMVASAATTICYSIIILLWTGIWDWSLAAYISNSMDSMKSAVFTETNSSTMLLAVDKSFSIFQLAIQDLIGSMITTALNGLYVGILIFLFAAGLSYYRDVTKLFGRLFSEIKN